jgi:hypothetical protein
MEIKIDTEKDLLNWLANHPPKDLAHEVVSKALNLIVMTELEGAELYDAVEEIIDQPVKPLILGIRDVKTVYNNDSKEFIKAHNPNIK